MIYLKAFLVGGVICGLSQVLIDRTRLTPARILSAYVVLGVLLSAAGIWGPVAEFAGAGATVPLLGFGHTMAEGVRTAVAEQGLLGAFTGGLTASAGGVAAAVFFSLLAAFLFRPGDRS
ncbi:MAG: SpoVA/SpoVAEb family sporulation membrane protein [Clostridia bacterium]|nr:SpoVA/SpoVAEb family sporulation membrane protein [Clostridia bacterium]